MGNQDANINRADLEYKDDLAEDPMFNLETADDVIMLKEAAAAGKQVTQTRAHSVLSGATFDTQFLDPRNRPSERASVPRAELNDNDFYERQMGQIPSNERIEIDFDDLRSVVTDITDSDAQTVMTN